MEGVSRSAHALFAMTTAPPQQKGVFMMIGRMIPLVAAVNTALLVMILLSENVKAFSITRNAQTLLTKNGAISISPVSFHRTPLQMSDSDNDVDGIDINQGPSSTNVLGTSLKPCCTNVRDTEIGTGFYRNGYCSTGEQDVGRHTVCVSR